MCFFVGGFWFVLVFFKAQNPYHNASLLEQSGLHRITLGTSTVSSVSSARYVNMQTLHHEFAFVGTDPTRNHSIKTSLIGIRSGFAATKVTSGQKSPHHLNPGVFCGSVEER